jgi:hypothetical protein
VTAARRQCANSERQRQQQQQQQARTAHPVQNRDEQDGEEELERQVGEGLGNEERRHSVLPRSMLPAETEGVV